MGSYWSRPSSDVFDQPDSELFGDHFFIAGIKYSSEKIKLDQSQREGRNDTRQIDSRLDTRLLFGSKEDMKHLGRKAFPFSGPLPNGSEPLTTLRASIFVQRDTLRLIKDVGETSARNMQHSLHQPLLNQFFFSCKFDADVPGTAYLYQRATESLKDNKLSFTGDLLCTLKFEKTGTSIELTSTHPIDHKGLETELNESIRNKTEPSKVPLVLHIVADDLYHPGHSHAVYMKVEGSGNQYAVKIDKINQCNNGVVYLMQEIYNVESGNGGGGTQTGIDEDTISPADVERSQCAVCLERPMDSVLLPCRHLAFCSSCAVTMKQHNSVCPFCRKPYLVVLQVFFLKKKSECSVAESNAAEALAQTLLQQAHNNTWANDAQPGKVPEGMVRLPIGLVVSPPPTNPHEIPSHLNPSFGGSALPGSLNGSLARNTFSRSRSNVPTLQHQYSAASIQFGTTGGNSPNIFPGDYGGVYGSATLASKYQLGEIYEKDEHKNETIQRPPMSMGIAPGSRALPKIPGDPSGDTATLFGGSYEVVDSGVKPQGFQADAAEVHASNPSITGTPASVRKQKGANLKSQGRTTKVAAELPHPPPDMLMSSRSNDEEEERVRTLNPSQFASSSGGSGDGVGSHRAAFPMTQSGTVKRDTHQSDIYETPSPRPDRALQPQPQKAPSLEKQVAEHKQRGVAGKGVAGVKGNIIETKLTGRDSPSHSPMGRSMTPSRGVAPAMLASNPKSIDHTDNAPPPLMHSGISLKSLPRDGRIRPGQMGQKQSKLLSQQHQPQNPDLSRSLQNTSPSRTSSPSGVAAGVRATIGGDRDTDKDPLSLSLSKEPRPLHESATPSRSKQQQLSSNYVNWPPKRPPRATTPLGASNSANKETSLSGPPPVPARGQSMTQQQQKMTPKASNVAER